MFWRTDVLRESLDRDKFFKAVAQCLRALMLPFFVVVAVVFFDLLSKYLIESNMRLYQTIDIIPRFFELYYTRNDGAAFSLFSGQQTFFIVITIPAVIVLGYFIYRFRNKERFLKISLALIMGGALGNFWDRLMYGEVRDFIQVVYGGADLPLLGTRFATFNIADSALVVGEIMIIFYFLFVYVDPKDAKAVEKHRQKLEKKQRIIDQKIAETVVSVEDFLNGKASE